MERGDPTKVGRDRVREVLGFQGRTQQWLAHQTGISFYRLTRLLAGERTYWDWEAQEISRALQVPLSILFEDLSVLRPSGRQIAATRRAPSGEDVAQQVEAVAS